MLKRFNTLFSKNTDPLKSLSPEETQRIQTFSDNLDTLDNSTNDSNRLSYFRRIISLFQNAFQNLTPWQSQTERIKGLYSKFTSNLFNNTLLQSVFENPDMFIPLFKCLVIMSHQNNDCVPLSSKFVPFFCQLIKSIKNSKDNRLLKSSFEFLTILFKDSAFFNEFLEADGFTLIFTSFFLTNDKEPIDMMMNLLFCVVPPQFYKEPSMMAIAIILDALKTETEIVQSQANGNESEPTTATRCCPKCAIFLVHYLCSHYSNYSIIFVNFQSEGGFLTLNNFLKECCSYKEAIDCYKMMTSKTENDPLIIQSLFHLYVDSTSEFKTHILKFLLTLPAEEIHRGIPVHEWITEESQMTDEQIELVCRIMLNLKNYNDYLPTVLQILEKPTIRFEVCDIFLDFLQMLVATNKMPIEALVEKKFLETFILHPKTDSFMNFLSSHPAIPHLILALYSSPTCEEYRFTIISKLISCFSSNLTGLLKRLCSVDFSLEVYNLLLNNLTNPEIIELVIIETEDRYNAFNLFIECNGFEIFDEILSDIEKNQNSVEVDEQENEEKKKKNEALVTSIVRVIGALTTYGPRPRIDEWINSLPIDSPFFAMVDKKLLSSIAVNKKLFLNVPSLLLYVEKFDFTSPLCLFNAGKFGIPMFLKRSIPVTQIPYLDKISNRYAPPTIMKYLFSQVENVESFIDITVPQYPIFELVPNERPTVSMSNFKSTDTPQNQGQNQNQNQDNQPKSFLPASLVFRSPSNQQPINSIRFEFFIPNQNESLVADSADLNKSRITIMSCSQIIITYNDSIVTFQTNKSKSSVFAKRGEPNVIQLNFTFNDVEGKLNGQPIERLKSDQGYPNEIVFGDPIKPNQIPRIVTQTQTQNLKPIFISRQLFINEQLPKIFESTQSVYTVGYLGFASYISTMKEAEAIFLKLEKFDTIQPFSSLFTALLHIQKSRNLEATIFWKRLLLSLKRANSSIQDNLLLFLHQLPSSVYDENEYTLFLITILSDYELYFIINKNALISFLALVESSLGDSTSGVNLQLFIGKNGSMINKFIYIIRSGVSDEIKEKMLSIIAHMLSLNEDNQEICLREFLLNGLTVGDWSLQLPLEFEQFPVHSLLPLSIPESRFQKKFFRIFLKNVNELVNKYSDNLNQLKEILSLNELLQFSLLFDDINRSLYFFKIISIYSSKNPKYLQNSKLLVYAFTKKALYRETWVEAFAILQGKTSKNDLMPHKKSKSKKSNLSIQDSPVIRRPVFVETFLSMLNCLLGLEAKKSIEIQEEIRKKKLETSTPDAEADSKEEDDNDNDNNNKNEDENNKDDLNVLVNEILEALTRLVDSDFSYFSSCFIQLANLSNFGLIPNSTLISLSNPRARIENEIKIDDVKLTDSELKSISDNSKIFKHPDILSATFPVEITLHPFDMKGLKWIKRLPFDNIILFLTNVVCSIDQTSNFNNTFMSIAFGSTLMYASYSKHFIYEFISQVIIHYTQSDTMKPCPLSVALKAAKASAFESNYLHFLSLSVSLMKRKFDSSNIKDFREVILLSFHFIKGKQERSDLDNFFNSFRSVIFHPAVLDDANFCHLLNYNNVKAQMNPKYLQSYDPSDAEKKWNDYISNNVTSTFDNDCRTSLTTQIMTNMKTFAAQGIKFTLLARINRICNHYNKTIQQANSLNTYLRIYENFYFKCLKSEIFYRHFASTFFPYTNPDSKIRKENLDENVCEKSAKSFHLSMLFMPYSSPRLMITSPFEIKSPPKGSKVPLDYFKFPAKTPISKIPQVEFNGELQCSPEWFMEQRQFEYSFVLQTSSLLQDFQSIYGKFNESVQVYLYYFIHPIPCVLFFSNDKMCLLFLATIRENKLGLISEPHAPIALIPFNESCFLNEWHSVSLFCGHFVLIFESSRFVKVEPHLYVHKKRALSFFYMFDPNFILIFDSLIDYENIDKKVRSLTTISSSSNIPFGSASSTSSLSNLMSPSSSKHSSNSSEINMINGSPSGNFEGYGYKYFSFVNSNSGGGSNNSSSGIGSSSNSNQISISMAKGFNVGSLFFNISFLDCLKLWIENRISTYDYLIYLNYQSGRAFADCAQYPVFPWVIAPSLEGTRNMSLPMGQQSEKRAQHYDETYKESIEPNKYFYGCHYSLPGAVFWFMMRVPPFSYFLWDMNEGWDDNQRMFYSINESYMSASVVNQTDLKEPIPEIYTMPELYENTSKLDIIEDRQNVALPEWSNNSPFLFTEVFRKYLEKNDEINNWIDLIFGYKQQGEAALKAKNIFLPSAYHSSTAEMMMIDANAYEDQVINFGQCPYQLFNKEHPPRNKLIRNNIRTLTQKICPQIVELYYNTQKHESNSIPLRSPNSSTSNLFLLSSSKRGTSSSSIILQSSPTSHHTKSSLLSEQPSSLPTNNPLLNDDKLSLSGSLGSQFNESPLGQATTNSSCDEKNIELAPSDGEVEISSSSAVLIDDGQTSRSHYDSYTSLPRSSHDRNRRNTNFGSLPPSGAILQGNASDSSSILSPSAPRTDAIMRRSMMKRSQARTLQSNAKAPFGRNRNNKNDKNDINNIENSLLYSSYTPFSDCFSNPDSFRLGKNATVLPEKSVSIPPFYDYFITIEGENETITVRKTINHDLMCSITSSEFGFIHSISISNDGVFIAFSFESGYVKIYFIYYELRVPRYIEHVASFIGPCGCRCKMSVILSQDFICASQFGSEIIMWNFATGYVHRIIDFSKNRSRSFVSQSGSGGLTEKEISMNKIFNYYEDDSVDNGNVNMPIDMIFDNFDGSLTVLFRDRIEQFSINGKKLRTYRSDPSKSSPLNSPNKDNINSYSSASELLLLQNEEFEFTCFAHFPFDFTFDGRIFIIGNNYGGIDFVVASSDNVEEFILIGSKNHLFKSRVKNIFVSSKESKVWACDDKKHAVELYIPIFEGITHQPSLPAGNIMNMQQADLSNANVNSNSNNKIDDDNDKIDEENE